MIELDEERLDRMRQAWKVEGPCGQTWLVDIDVAFIAYSCYILLLNYTAFVCYILLQLVYRVSM